LDHLRPAGDLDRLIDVLKQESQRRERDVCMSERSLASSIEVQKHVGQTMVQIAASEASLRHVVPARVLQIARQQLVQIVRAHLAAHGGSSAGDDGFGRRDVVKGCGALGQLGKHRASLVRPRLDQEDVFAAPETSVSARSKPVSALGPVFMETQKHVPPA
jgi:hypothetical protein